MTGRGMQQILPETEGGPLTAGELRRLATYLQYRLDRAQFTDDMNIKRALLERMILVIEAAQRGIQC